MKELVLGLFVTLVFLFFVFFISHFIANTQCNFIGQEMNLPSKYGVFTGCMIKPNKNWVPLGSYREL